MPLDKQQIQGLLDLLYDHLSHHPQGVSEWNLVGELKARRLSPFAQTDLGDSLALFQLHFFLFHLLYRLQDHLSDKGEFLHIHCLNIQLRPQTYAERQVQPHDPLREYYLDWKNQENTERSQVEQMLKRFWENFDQERDKTEAYQVLNLSAQASKDEIKAQYRKLAQKLHPDTGGSGKGFEKITWAKNLLLG